MLLTFVRPFNKIIRILFRIVGNNNSGMELETGLLEKALRDLPNYGPGQDGELRHGTELAAV
jgi:hypothetical protein